MLVRTACVCGKQAVVRVDPKGYELWRGGMLIQLALPYLAADERERLITGTCIACWTEMMTED